jgi:hypothetical protein
MASMGICIKRFYGIAMGNLSGVGLQQGDEPEAAYRADQERAEGQ